MISPYSFFVLNKIIPWNSSINDIIFILLLAILDFIKIAYDKNQHEYVLSNLMSKFSLAFYNLIPATMGL